jgi:hypothetical protein
MLQQAQETKFVVVSFNQQTLITITIKHKPHNDPVEKLRSEIGEWLNTDAGNEAWQYSLAEFNWGNFIELAPAIVEWSEWLLSFSVDTQHDTSVVNYDEHLIRDTTAG